MLRIGAHMSIAGGVHRFERGGNIPPDSLDVRNLETLRRLRDDVAKAVRSVQNG